MKRYCISGILFLVSFSLAYGSCKNLSAEEKRVFCGTNTHKKLFGKMSKRYDELVKNLESFAVRSIEDEQADFIKTYSYSCGTSNGLEQIRLCGRKRIEERIKVLAFRLANPVKVKAPSEPKLPFAKYCSENLKKQTSEGKLLRHFQSYLNAKSCKEMDDKRLGITRFSFSLIKGQDIEVNSLIPFSYLTNLRKLVLPYGSKFGDLTPISNLTLLTELSVSASKISSIESIRGLKNLEDLGIRTTFVKDIATVFKLPRLLELDVRNLSVNKKTIAKFKVASPHTKVYD